MASQIEIAQLPADRIQLLKDINKLDNIESIWHGIHGFIVVLEQKSIESNLYMDKDDMSILANCDIFRWIEPKDNGRLSIGI